MPWKASRPAALSACLMLAACGGSSSSAPAPSPVARGGQSIPDSARERGPDARRVPGPPVSKKKLPPAGVAGESCGGADVPLVVACLLNAQREAAGLGALRFESQLARAAQMHADDMLARKFFSHRSPEGASVADRSRTAGYITSSSDWVVGENLGWGSGPLGTPAAIVDGWMRSPGHRANVLAADYRDVGVAVKPGAPLASLSGGTVYVAVFGARSTRTALAAAPGGGGTAGSGTAPSSRSTDSGRRGARSRRHARRVLHRRLRRCRRRATHRRRVRCRHHARARYRRAIRRR